MSAVHIPRTPSTRICGNAGTGPRGRVSVPDYCIIIRLLLSAFIWGVGCRVWVLCQRPWDTGLCILSIIVMNVYLRYGSKPFLWRRLRADHRRQRLHSRHAQLVGQDSQQFEQGKGMRESTGDGRWVIEDKNLPRTWSSRANHCKRR